MNQIVKILLQSEKILCNMKEILQESSYTYSLRLTVNLKILILFKILSIFS